MLVVFDFIGQIIVGVFVFWFIGVFDLFVSIGYGIQFFVGYYVGFVIGIGFYFCMIRGKVVCIVLFFGSCGSELIFYIIVQFKYSVFYSISFQGVYINFQVYFGVIFGFNFYVIGCKYLVVFQFGFCCNLNGIQVLVLYMNL